MCGALFQRAIRAGRVIACAALLAGCTQVIHNDPVNQPLTANPRRSRPRSTPDVPDNYDDMVVALSFSGGGTRAAAFSYGVLTGFEQTRVPTRAAPVSLLDRLDFSPAFPAARCLRPITACAAAPGWPISSSVSSLPMRRKCCRPISASAISPAACEGGVNDTTGFRSGSTRICTTTRRSRTCSAVAAAGLDQRLRHL